MAILFYVGSQVIDNCCSCKFNSFNLVSLAFITNLSCLDTYTCRLISLSNILSTVYSQLLDRFLDVVFKVSAHRYSYFFFIYYAYSDYMYKLGYRHFACTKYI